MQSPPTHGDIINKSFLQKYKFTCLQVELKSTTLQCDKILSLLRLLPGLPRRMPPPPPNPPHLRHRQQGVVQLLVVIMMTARLRM